jgi:hypothetical protein
MVEVDDVVRVTWLLVNFKVQTEIEVLTLGVKSF